MTPRKAFLMAAGLGTRLRPLTDKTPKCLLPLGGEPLLHWWLRLLEKLGVTEALINTHHLAAQVEAFLASRRHGVRVRTVHEPALLGSAGTVAANRAFVDSEPSFWIIYADTLVAADLSGLAKLHGETGACLTLGLFRAPDPSACGVVELGAQGKVKSFEEKPARPRSDLAAAGVYIAGPELLRRLPPPKDIPPGGMDLSRHLLPQLVACARGELLQGKVIDIGTPETYERACQDWSGIGLERMLQAA